MNRVAISAAACAAALGAVPAGAMVITKTFEVDGTNVTPLGHSTPFPASSLRGIFVIEWDTAKSVDDQRPVGAGLSWASQSAPNFGQFVFSYDVRQDRLALGGHGKVEEALSGGWDFYLTIYGASTDRITSGMSVQQGSRLYMVENLAVTQALAAPEPATWGMMVAGFGLLGAALRRPSSARGTSRTPAPARR